MFKKISLRHLPLLLLCAFCLYSVAQAQEERAEAPLNNASIVKLVRAGFKDKTVIAIIRTRQTHFDLAPDRLIELKRGGVSENVILAMLARDDGIVADNDDFDNDAFFNDGKNLSTTKKPEAESENATDIFGSGSGSRGSTRSRGLNGNNEGDTQTSGSVSVKIMRPQAEAGGAPKLERTPTLNNDSIVELVEAGFSEGTIIRRIEGSPVDFDMSPAKLVELRRRRVSERIIAAMKAALGDEAATNATPSGTTP